MTKLMAKTSRTDGGGWAVWASDTGGRGYIVLDVVASLDEARAAVIYLQS